MFKKELFNKAKIFKKENSNLNKFYKSLYMKKSKTNLKISVVNTNTSSNLSNKYLKTTTNLSYKYLKTSSNSKKTPDNSSIFKSMTQLNQISKKSLFNNISKNKNGHYSAKFLKHFGLRSNKKSDKKFFIRRTSNDQSTKGYYLTGELPFRNKYILEMNKSYLNIYKNKKDMIKYHIGNNTSYNSLHISKSNMKQQEKKIEKLAKKLKIVLNSEDKKRHKTKCNCGNLVTFNNGFFNGINIVMSQSPMEGQSENKQSDVYADGYNFIPTNLPMFLREKFNIKGTTVISPFCMEARDDFLFKRIFYDDKKKDQFKNKEVIDNKLNIIYAENQAQYYKNLVKFNNMLKQNGKKILHEVGPTVTDIKLSKIKNKMSFMKKIVDYAYPNMVLTRVRESEKVIRKKILSEEKLPPFKKADELTKQNNIHLGNLLKKSIKIKIINK